MAYPKIVLFHKSLLIDLEGLEDYIEDSQRVVGKNWMLEALNKHIGKDLVPDIMECKKTSNLHSRQLSRSF